ncbi:MAG: lysylphosphatidylglycerol synthase domain-containing protein [Rhodospirillales bacterium]|nr:lysylphosphatidylglycerol synthase domain-containing protein [Rhodospirillales bacterium]
MSAKKLFKSATMVSLILGLFVVTALIAWQGAGVIGEAVLGVGYGIFAVVGFHFVPIALAALAWWVLFKPSVPAGVPFFVIARWVREGVNTLLPVAQIGGDVVGARILIQRGGSTNTVSASLFVDKTLEVFSQFFVALAGVILLFDGGDREWLGNALIGLLILFPLLVGFLLAQRWGLLRLTEKLLVKLTGTGAMPQADIAGIHDAAWAMYRHGPRCASGLVLHTLAWGAGAAEIWLILYFMGYPVGWVEAFALEALGQAIRSAAFAMPGALGAQEAGYMILAPMVGLGPEIGLALSLVKRVRHVMLGVPALLIWQFLEGRHLFKGRRKSDANQQAGHHG